MGLDQYAYRRSGKIEADVDFEEENADKLIYQWRKHPNLQGWMENLYKEKLGKSDDFNCDAVQLTPADIDRLERDVNENFLPPTIGFFFGQSDEKDKDSDREFIKRAREAFAEGDSVYYTSWW